MADIEVKSFLKSKTIWLNIIGLAVIILQSSLSLNLLGDPEYQALALALLNILLRFSTDSPIKLK